MGASVGRAYGAFRALGATESLDLASLLVPRYAGNRLTEAHRSTDREASYLTVFISHSFENRPEFENVTDWLRRVDVPFWRPSDVKSGDSLREQLRDAISGCSVCIFVATHKSVQSSWCGAELGAFWGAGVPIIVYLADSSLPDAALPPIVQGDVWERRLSRIAERASELTRAGNGTASNSLPPRTRISNITVEQLEKLVVGAVALVSARETQGADGSTESKAAIARDAAGRILRGAEITSHLGDREDEPWRHRILWVDDRPINNVNERGALESLGLEFVLAESTREALNILSRDRFAVIISDMGRREGPREGYVLLEAVRAKDKTTPFFIYAGSRAFEHRQEAAARGAQGTTNRPNELIEMVISALESQREQSEASG